MNRYYSLKLKFLHVMHQSIPAVPMPPPPAPPGQPRGIYSRCQPGGGASSNFIAARELGISVPQGDPRAFDTCAFERWMSNQEGRGLCQSQSFSPKESIKCINLRAKRYMVLIFLRERKQGAFAQQKAENCTLMQKRWKSELDYS